MLRSDRDSGSVSELEFSFSFIYYVLTFSFVICRLGRGSPNTRSLGTLLGGTVLPLGATMTLRGHHGRADLMPRPAKNLPGSRVRLGGVTRIGRQSVGWVRQGSYLSNSFSTRGRLGHSQSFGMACPNVGPRDFPNLRIPGRRPALRTRGSSARVEMVRSPRVA